MSALSGKSIRLFMVDGTPQGILTLEVMNWTGHALVSPRSRIAEMIKRPEMTRTGIYFLTGPDPDGLDRLCVYLGETDNVGKRLVQHSKDETKDFWEKACVITSKDMNLTKAHVRYLEGRLISIAAQSGYAKIFNNTAPQYDYLPEADIADMEYFISQIRLIMPVLGFEFLREKPQITSQIREVQKSAVEEAVLSMFASFEIYSKKYELTATAKETNAEFVVLAGSHAQPKWIGSEGHNYHTLFRTLYNQGKIVVSSDGQYGVFQENVAFSSPSAAAAIIYGRASNGRTAWKLKGSNKTYEDWQNDALSSFENQAA